MITCKLCNGTGIELDTICNVCKGKGLVNDNEDYIIYNIKEDIEIIKEG